jgi:hypothetical protein
MTKSSTLKTPVALPQNTKAESEPSAQTIANILAFSKAYKVKRSKHLKHIGQVMN